MARKQEADVLTDELYIEPEPSGNGDNAPVDEAVYTEETPQPDERHDERKPEPNMPRKTTADLVTMLWGGAGTYLAATGKDVPVGLTLQLQAPLAGEKIDAVIAHTWLDKVLQPFVQALDSVEGFGTLVAFPVMVALYERQPAMMAPLEGVFRTVVRQTLLDMAPVMRKQAADTKKAARSIPDLNEIFGIDRNADPVEAVIARIFQPAHAEQPASESADDAA